MARHSPPAMEDLLYGLTVSALLSGLEVEQRSAQSVRGWATGAYNELSEMKAVRALILHRDVVWTLVGMWDAPTVYLFATRLNKRLPLYYDPPPGRRSLWSGQPGCLLGGPHRVCVPPTPLILLVLNKAASSRVRLCLIAPCWPNQSWFPEWDRRLWHPIGRVFHETPSFFKLHAWRLSAISSESGFSEDVLNKSETGVGNTSFLRFLPHLSFLFSGKKFSVQAVKGYHSAIYFTLHLQGSWGSDWDVTISSLTRNMTFERPRMRHSSPKWYLSVVLGGAPRGCPLSPWIR
jgi:hypothetical protein